MSDIAHDDTPEPHEGPIKTPKQVIWTVVASFIVPVILIILLAQFVASGVLPGAGSDGLGAEAVARRIQPIGTVEVRDASGPAVVRSGEQVFLAQCGVCHTTGAANAPKLGDAAAWAARLKTGYEALLASSLKGKGAMPPQSGGEAADIEIAHAVVYMANQAGAKFEAPKAPAAAASAADATASAPK